MGGYPVDSELEGANYVNAMLKFTEVSALAHQVDGYTDEDIYTVGTAGMVEHFNGTTTTRFPLSGNDIFHCLHAAQNQVYVASANPRSRIWASSA